MAGGEGAGVVGAEALDGGGVQRLGVMDGRRDLTTLAEAAAGPEQKRVAAGVGVPQIGPACASSTVVLARRV